MTTATGAQRRHRYVARRYGTRQVEQRPDAIVADLIAAFDEAVTLGYVGDTTRFTAATAR
jgi:hypothetical protein